MTNYLTRDQVEHLLAPINPARVLDLKGKSYVAQHDIRAHLTRIFGFGRWSTEVSDAVLVFEEQDKNGRWKTCYRVTLTLTVCAPDGTVLARYTDCHASGNAPQPDRAEAHALALTSAVSTALKRAASCLGDQYGLSLYNKGQRAAFVKGTLVHEAPAIEEADVTDLGDEEPASGIQTEPQQGADADEGWLDRLRSHALNPDNGARILAVAGLKAEAEPLGILTLTTQVKGESVTYARLADLVASGAFLAGEATA